jgi:TRAP-type C4-dicarboxylate transport system substrate-binding protein
MARRSVWGTAALATCALALSACGTTGTTKAGGSAEPVILRLGTDDGDDAPTAPWIEAFAERVRELSDGALLVEPVHSAGSTAEGDQQEDWDQVVARKVSGGELELGLIPARAWDVEGVATLRPFSLPFLVTSEAHLDAVVRSDLAADMLAGLESAGVTGLALFPEGLRHTFSFGEPLTSPSDFAGTTIRASHSDTGWAVYEAWGATADDLFGPEYDDGVQSGAVAGADSTFARSAGLPGPAATVAGNLVTSANAQTLFVSTEVLDELTGDQVDVLRRAATEVRDETLADPAGEAAAAAEFCDRGGRITTASEADLAALEAAAQPVYDELNRDPVTADLVTAIRQIGAGAPAPDPVATCEPGPPVASAVATTPDTEGVFPEGVYRVHRTEAELEAAGMSALDAENHGGIWDLTFTDGRLIGRDVRDSDGQVSTDETSYCVSDGRVALSMDPGGCDERLLFTASWTMDGRQLRFTDIAAGNVGISDSFAEALWGGEPWTRID